MQAMGGLRWSPRSVLGHSWNTQEGVPPEEDQQRGWDDEGDSAEVLDWGGQSNFEAKVQE